MITLERLRVHNFFKLHGVDIELGQGIFLITGENRDEVSSLSNGAGKSLLCQSIVWCLFEDLLRKGVRVDDVVGKSDEWTSVCLDIDMSGQKVQIERYRKHPEFGNKVRLFVDGNEETMHSETNLRIQQMLQISPKTVYHCSYSDSEKPPIVAMTPAEIKKVVAEILNTQRFDDYIKQISKESSSLNTEIESKKAVFSKMGSQLDEAMKEKEELEIQIGSFEKERKARIGELELKKLQLQSDIKEALAQLKGEKKIRERLEEISDVKDKIAKISKEQKANNESLDEASKLLLKMQSLLVKQHAEVDSKKESRANIENNPTGMCAYCGNALSNSKHTVDILKSIQADIDAMEVKISKTDQKVNELKQIKKALEAKQQELEQSISQYHETFDEFKKLSGKLDLLSSVSVSIERAQGNLNLIDEKIAKIKEEEPPSTSVIDHLTKQIKTLTKSRKESWEEIEELVKKHEDYSVLKDAVNQVKVGLFNNFIYSLHVKVEDYLDEMTGGDFQVSIKETKNELSFLFSQPSKDGAFYPYTVFSKGEKARLRKAVQMAIESLMDVGFLIDDEGLDGVDDSGIPMILDFMLSKSAGKTIFVVGHQQALKDYFSGYPNIHVTKQSDVSTVEMRLV